MSIVFAILFVIALVMAHRAQDFRGWWQAIVVAGIRLQYSLTGAGGLSVDSLLAGPEEK